MPIILQKEIGRLKQMLIDLATLVEENVHLAVKAISDRDLRQAEKVIAADSEVDQMEVDVEEECLKILALHQPVAIDLRYIITALKMNNDLERIGDLAVNIAERSQHLYRCRDGTDIFDFEGMAGKAQAMLKKSLDAMINLDAGLAREVILMDDEIDEMNRQTFKKVEAEIIQTPDECDCLIRLLSVSRYLERIADHTTNIAEDVIYLIDGEIVRHQGAVY
jgi:phosphate transport system protein